ncbi:MAG: glycosyltransferase family 4 protein [Actinomycetota bacterium]|nr:glycosyltransferase family 4 protein [Actinomycetota bacterium]
MTESVRTETVDSGVVSVLALVPSLGIGGGIESYFAALSGALSETGANISTMAIVAKEPGATLRLKVRFALSSVMAARRLRHGESLLLVLHPALWFVGVLARRVARLPSDRCCIFSYGADISGQGGLGRRQARRSGWRILTISSFSAGAMAGEGPVTVLRPGVPRERYERLLEAGLSCDKTSRDIDILTVFRLDDAELKGVYELLRACQIVRRSRPKLSLVIAGSGEPPQALLEALIECSEWARLEQDLEFDDLASLFGRARVFALATRSHQPGRRGFRGEGFGIVLVEAQLAGTPVVAPCLGGSSDAFIEGLTGVRPRDESPEALAQAIQSLLETDSVRVPMAESARSWARQTFSPTEYGHYVRAILLGHQSE